MAFITISEIIAIIAMIFGIGYIFSDYFRKEPEDADEMLKYYSRRSNAWENTKFAAMVTAPPLVLHEFAHKIAAMSFGATAVLKAPYFMYLIVILLKMMHFPLLFFVGGYVSHSPLAAGPSAVVAVAGPLTNFLIWGVCVLIVKYNWLDSRYNKIIIPMGKISMFLGIFNMLPIPGFDGHHFFTSLISLF
ncbi:hypothetical protein GF336_05950 [Candidatus Woesearchaeota archaeon]|nr:hypothetical protein [Candidatus Woesearchaeota archaeon]